MLKTRIHLLLVTATLAAALFPTPLLAQARTMPKAAKSDMFQPALNDFGLKGKAKTVTQLTRFVGGQDLNKEEIWEFNEQGLLLRHTKKGFGGEHVTSYPLPRETDKRQMTLRDDDGDILEVRHYASDGRTLLTTIHYVYAKGGSLAATVAYHYSATDTGVVESHTETYYDKAGRVASVEQHGADATLLMTERYKYNRHGDLKQRTQQFFNDTQTDKVKETRQYKYDKTGNWTEQTYLHNGTARYTILRRITYYK
ncbi:MAG: hypothetical protein SPJ13_04365 [Bacteroidales bacterium]|nr:hypothetical protein [Bacteroidales bacterium]